MASPRRPLVFWARLVAEAERSSISETAKRHDVAASSLKWWRWKHGRECTKRPAGSLDLVPVVTSPALMMSDTAPAITIELGGELVFRVRIGSDQGHVASLLAAVRSTC